LIKLSADIISNKEYFLIIDADTILINKQIFVSNSKMIINCSDEYHLPYFEMLKRILRINNLFCLSFVSHYMIFNRHILFELKAKIEEFSRDNWAKVIIDKVDKFDSSGFSEYETYGNYLYNYHKNKIELCYWFNLSLKRSSDANLEDLISLYSKKYKSISLHYYS
jgi:hypothetical protein